MPVDDELHKIMFQMNQGGYSPISPAFQEDHHQMTSTQSNTGEVFCTGGKSSVSAVPCPVVPCTGSHPSQPSQQTSLSRHLMCGSEQIQAPNVPATTITKQTMSVGGEMIQSSRMSEMTSASTVGSCRMKSPPVQMQSSSSHLAGQMQQPLCQMQSMSQMPMANMTQQGYYSNVSGRTSGHHEPMMSPGCGQLYQTNMGPIHLVNGGSNSGYSQSPHIGIPMSRSGYGSRNPSLNAQLSSSMMRNPDRSSLGQFDQFGVGHHLQPGVIDRHQQQSGMGHLQEQGAMGHLQRPGGMGHHHQVGGMGHLQQPVGMGHLQQSGSMSHLPQQGGMSQFQQNSMGYLHHQGTMNHLEQRSRIQQPSMSMPLDRQSGHQNFHWGHDSASMNDSQKMVGVAFFGVLFFLNVFVFNDNWPISFLSISLISRQLIIVCF